MERNYSIDFVKFFAIFLVVTIHTGTVSGIYLGNVNGDNIDFVIDSFARCAVPFFFITSGYLFMQKMNSIQADREGNVGKKQFSYLRKYILKLGLLYFSWFIFYFLYELIINIVETEKSAEALTAMFTDFIASFPLIDIFYYGSDVPQYHLWFLLTLIWSVIVLFTFMKLRLVKVLFFLGLALHIYGLFGQSYSTFYEVPYNTRDAVFFGIFYITLGGLFAKYSNPLKHLADSIKNIEYIILIVVLSITQVVEAYITMVLLEGNAQNYFVTTIPLIFVIFLAIVKHPSIGKNSFISKIGANAVGIYVSHVFIMKFIRFIMYKNELSEIQNTLIWKLTFTPMVFIIAYFFYAGLQKLKKRVKN
ncbi:acyltransferase [Virgibacillus flavescens]|uniref:acyltransferase n=1 Tax=Virgibacillus flavescens TaxID=1611422 RepID=UPI003D3403FA